MKRNCLFLALAILLSVLAAPAHAGGLKADDALFREVASLDQKLFQAYNDCDLSALAAMVDEHLEFYHDKSGLMQGKADFIAAIRSNICNKVERRLVAPTLEVFPLQNYGAIEIGEHTFCNRMETPVCKDETNGIGRFFMLWQKQGDVYRLTRVISYDHLSDRERKAVVTPVR